MNNDPELDGKYLGKITKDFAQVAEVLKEASYQIRRREISAFPIFPVSRQILPVGQVILPIGHLGIKWNFSASFLQEFIDRKLVLKENEDRFKSTYREPDEYCCLFVVDEGFTNFVYIPYPED